MLASGWGNSLAVRLRKALVEALALKEGDEIALLPADPKTMMVAGSTARGEMLASALEAGCSALLSKKECSFLKKRTKRLLSVGCGGMPPFLADKFPRVPEQKFFVSFFQKRNTSFLPSPSPS